ncbi:Na+-transporting NADH:ubiquinone oxidoreductase subunit E [Candidatus Scalindua japonica]|uniref:Na+-transporting NADH:ubiquinone oxidoreductase subunit E n=1 Tax=Candidatus Scalindua japonica TaxID=1284222 RepID=A0A286TXH5_9BACT|nr:Rnf-Nqr domain containing protein [Candidatus Scalindua japonica]GAX60577.1 Na+-transporting NADH:ubiquinone oxidoreductase subunit E [Candidatus Scalindua japonica]
MNMLPRYIRLISKFFLRDNYIISAAAGLGFCSALAVTNKMENSLTMGVGVVFVTCLSFCLVYPFKKLIITTGTHHKITLLMIIISVFVTIFNLIVQATIPRIAFNIKAYIDLITTNCIVLAVIAEGLTFGFWDAQKKILKACLGYSIALIFLALMREPLGFGTLLNFRILPESFPVVVLMITPVGGFFALALWRFMLRPLFVKTGVVYQENVLEKKEEVTEVETTEREKKPAFKMSGKLIIIIVLGVLLIVSLITNIKAVTSLNNQFQILLPIFLSALFFDGIVLSKLLGICPLLNKSRQVDSAWKMGLAVVIVVTLSTSLNWLVYNKILIGASNYLSSISPVPIRLERIFYLTVFIVTIATFVQILGVLLRRFAIETYQQMGQFLELITVNCIVLASSTFTIPPGLSFMATTVTAFGFGLHWLMVCVWLALLRRHKLFVPCNTWDEDSVAILLLGIMAAIFTGIGAIAIF